MLTVKSCGTPAHKTAVISAGICCNPFNLVPHSLPNIYPNPFFRK